jgi:hypothetical protein
MEPNQVVESINTNLVQFMKVNGLKIENQVSVCIHMPINKNIKVFLYLYENK